MIMHHPSFGIIAEIETTIKAVEALPAFIRFRREIPAGGNSGQKTTQLIITTLPQLSEPPTEARKK
jgi:hypothetical protein